MAESVKHGDSGAIWCRSFDFDWDLKMKKAKKNKTKKQSEKEGKKEREKKSSNHYNSFLPYPGMKISFLWTFIFLSRFFSDGKVTEMSKKNSLG